ncbi:MAG: efflux RND transporter periplasmic adaptor subunit [Oscillospiraceae bacterium]|nr:efflux RND transporter periplasmic adaptor subunit [Oscillospiraceae bacterium]
MKTKTKKIKSKKSKLVKKIIIWCLVAGLLLWFALLRIDVNTASNKYDYAIPFEERNISEFRPASGKIVMKDIESVSTDVTQKIKKVYCKVGDKVKEGDILCEFESEDLDDQIARIEKYLSDKNKSESLAENSSSSTAERARQAAQIRVDSAAMALESARKSYDDTYAKYSDYFDRCYSTDNPEEAQMYLNMYNSYYSQLEPINQQIREAQKELDEARKAASEISENQKDAEYEKSLISNGDDEYEKQLEKLKNEKEHLVVTAHRSGIIAESYASEGGYAVDGCLFRIGSLGEYKAETYVGSQDILDIKTGMTATVKTILTGADTIEARVVRVSDVFSTANNGYAVELEILDNSYMSQLRHNVKATAKIYSSDLGNLPAVQYDAIAEDKDGNAYVFRAVKRGAEYIAEKVPVEKGYEGSFYVEVRSDELKEGDLIIGNGNDHHDGDRIKIKRAE